MTAAGFGNAGWNSSASPSLGVQVAGGSGTLPFESTLGMPHARPCVVSRRSQHESLHDLFCCEPRCEWRPVGLPSHQIRELTTVAPQAHAHTRAVPRTKNGCARAHRHREFLNLNLRVRDAKSPFAKYEYIKSTRLKNLFRSWFRY